MNRVTFGWATGMGLVGACCAALVPVFSGLPATWGATVAAILTAVTIVGRQVQAVVQTMYGGETVVSEHDLLDDLPTEPTDVALLD